ncbi:hypothetical protein CPAV1605_1407 [seawater metagenome]|uniref:Uncharacterized protein n=1 Tax=seawater metagenome TaxID=1561972 RepID=A0A5E8CL89_9ZZZZ
MLLTLSLVNYIRIISIPILLTSQFTNNLFKNFVAQFGIYVSIMLIIKKFSLIFEATLKSDVMKLLLNRIITKQEQEYIGLIPNTVFADISSFKTQLSSVLGQSTDSISILISIILVLIYNFKNYGVYFGIFFLSTLIATIYSLFKKNKLLFKLSSETNTKA